MQRIYNCLNSICTSKKQKEQLMDLLNVNLDLNDMFSIRSNETFKISGKFL